MADKRTTGQEANDHVNCFCLADWLNYIFMQLKPTVRDN